MSKYLSYGKLSKKHNAFISKISNLHVPRNIQEALNDSDWKSAVMEEMNALRKSGTWEVVDLPMNKKNSWVQIGIYSKVQVGWKYREI